MPFCFREELLRCDGMSCEEKAMAEELTELLMNELTMGEYQSPEAAKVQLAILFRIHYTKLSTVSERHRNSFLQSCLTGSG